MLQFLFLALLAVGNALCLSTYSVGVSNQTSVVVTSSQHGFTNDKIAVHAYNGSGARVADTAFTKAIDPYTYEVTVTFGSSFSGTVKLTGAFTTADVTNAARDFDAGTVTGQKIVQICSTCTLANPAFAGAGTKKYFGAGSVTYQAVAGRMSTVLVYLDAGQLVFQVARSAEAGTITSGKGIVRVGVGIPTGAERLHDLVFPSTQNAPTITERRGWL